MVDVKMRVHDDIDVFRPYTVPLELVEQTGFAVRKEGTGLRPGAGVDKKRHVVCA
jgi:hypothetical protein